MEEVEIAIDFRNNAFYYCFHTLGYENPKILGDMIRNPELHTWDNQAMKVIEVQLQNAVDEEEESLLT